MKTVFARTIRLASLLTLARVLTGCGGDGAFGPAYKAPSGVTVSISPQNATAVFDHSIQFTAVVRGTSNQSVTWSVITANGGTITPQGMYTAPNAHFGQFTVKAQSESNPNVSATSIVSVSDVG